MAGAGFNVATTGDGRGLAALREAVERVTAAQIGGESRTGAGDGGQMPGAAGGRGVRLGWPAIDAALGGLMPGVVHEWIGAGWNGPEGAGAPRRGAWSAPLGVLVHVARRAWRGCGRRGIVVWVGRACWPTGWALEAGDKGGVLDSSVMVDAGCVGERVWAVDVALRSAGVSVVVADGSGLGMAESRRWQLAAGSGGCVVLAARPPWEVRALSAARTRWLVEPAAPSDGERSPCWSVELLRCKGVQPVPEGARRMVVRRDDATGDVGVVQPVGDRLLAATGAA
jgi:hypothetical protein